MTVRITIKRGGPILVSGEVELVDQNGNAIIPPPAKNAGTFKLCACTCSATLPFCDGSHNKPTSS